MSERHYPEDLRYHAEHVWARVEDGEAVVGITDHAQDALGEVVYVELPGRGDRTTVGEPFGELESVKAVSDVYAPLSGEVTEVNDRAEDAPELVNEDCYGDGWLIKLRMDDDAELDDLMDADTYRGLLERG